MRWKVNGKCLDFGLEGAFLDFDVVVNGGFGLISKGDVLQDVRSGRVVEVDGVVAVGFP